MKAILFAPLANGKGKSDAGWFQHEANAFADTHGVDRRSVHLFGNDAPMPARRAQIKHWLESQAGLMDAVVFSCHGWAPSNRPPIVHGNGIQAGYEAAQVPELAASLKLACVQAPVIFLLCCSAGQDNNPNTVDTQVPGPGGEGGFADLLRRDLVKAGVSATIYAHESVGPASTNPFVRRFSPGDMAGGMWVIAPHADPQVPNSELWHAWVKELNGTSGLRFRFPFMSQAEIEAELRASTHFVAAE